MVYNELYNMVYNDVYSVVRQPSPLERGGRKAGVCKKEGYAIIQGVCKKERCPPAGDRSSQNPKYEKENHVYIRGAILRFP